MEFFGCSDAKDGVCTKMEGVDYAVSQINPILHTPQWATNIPFSTL
jgi:hypothetical protein